MNRTHSITASLTVSSIFLATFLLGCTLQPTQSNSDPTLSQPLVKGVPDTGASATGSLAISFTPQSDGGNFDPANVWAVWITDNDGTWVRNVNARAGMRANHLTHWVSDYKSTIARGVDGVTGATVYSFMPFSGSWDLTNGRSTTKLPQGSYHVNMQFADDNSAGPFASVLVTVGTSAIDTTVPSSTFPYHKYIHLTYTP